MSRQGPTPRRRTVIRYEDAAGNRCRKGDSGAKAINTKTDTYYAKLGGKWVSLGTTDLGTAWRELKRRQEDDADPVDAHRRRPLTEHLEAFQRHMGDKPVTEEHRVRLLRDVRKLASLASWTRLAHLTADSLRGALAVLGKQGRSAQTRKLHLRHAVQFARWCVATGRMARQPFMEVKAPNVKTDRRHSRRCPTDDELRQLWLYLDKPVCPDRRKLSARCRAIGYRVCMGTGFRAGELMRLSRQHFDLDRAIVMLPAKDDKRGKPVLQPLPAWLVTELREWFGGGGGCWQKITSKSRSLLKEDLIAAGVPYAVNGPDGPEFFDMHALRVRYITDLCMDPKNDIKTIMHLARHSDARLTLEIYAKCRPDAVRATVDRLPRPGGE